MTYPPPGYGQPSQPWRPQVPPSSRPQNGLGTAGLVLGTVGLVFAFIPIVDGAQVSLPRPAH
jgi:hypothetical protein